jgi:uncharacterized protein YgiM (DUF1202 family)
MKKLCVLLIAGFVASGLVSALELSRGNAMYVAVRQLPLKTASGFFANANGTLEYGDRVTVLQTDGKFVEVRCVSNSSLNGWVPAANLSRHNLFRGETEQAGLVMAEVENTFRAQRNLNFADVDRIEAIPVDQFYLRMFLEEGRLSMGEN